MSTDIRHKSIFDLLLGDGIFLLTFTGIVLIFSGLFVIVQCITGHFLPHDVVYLGIDAEGLSRFYDGRITLFMYHDRIAFGGSIIAVGTLYMWMASFPLRAGQSWAWWIFLLSGIVGFGSFLTYLGYGYLDNWHGAATIVLLPFYIMGLIYSYRSLIDKPSLKDITFSYKPEFSSGYDVGKLLLVIIGLGLFVAGITIMIVGMTVVFVPQDLSFMRTNVCGLQNVSTKLIPLIAHDRACFGGGLATIGLMTTYCVIKADQLRSLWEVLCIALSVGFVSAIGVHFWIGYLDISHLAPAYFGAILAAVALALTARKMLHRM